MVGNTKESSKERAKAQAFEKQGLPTLAHGASYLLPGAVERLEEESSVPLAPPGVRPLPLEPDELDPVADDPPEAPPGPS